MKALISLLTILILLSSINLFAANRIIFYQGNYGMISETLELPLIRGNNQFVYDKVSPNLIDNTIMLIPERPESFLVQTQGFVVETRGFANILRKHLNKDIEVVTKDGSIISGKLFYYDHELLALEEKNSTNTVFVRIAEVRNYIFKADDFEYESAPKIVWTINADRGGTYRAQLSYLTGGLNWSGLYKAIWDEEFLQLEVLANITNNTGIDYENFSISLVAGDPKRISQPSNFAKAGYGYAEADMMFSEAASRAPEFVAESLDEYHIYTYSEEVDLKHSESKQIRLFPPKRIKPEVYYEYVTNSKNLQTKLKIVNNERNGLGIVLPKGSVQIYRQAASSSDLNFVGEDRVEQRPVNEDWIISPGQASDLVGETTLIATRRPARNVTENDMLVKLRNRSQVTKKIVVIHYIRGNWNLLRQNHPHEQIDATKIEFHKELRPDEEYVITWTERIEY